MGSVSDTASRIPYQANDAEASKLSITHISFGQEISQMDVGQAG
jgi:hypothetical protein